MQLEEFSFIMIQHYLHLSIAMFLLGLTGLFFFRRSLIMMLVALEIVLLSVSLNFIIFSNYLDDFQGQLFSLLILTVAGAESSIGLALLVVYHKMTGVISAFELTQLKG
jgi:NADH-quinone oxidoreductase subunit K